MIKRCCLFLAVFLICFTSSISFASNKGVIQGSYANVRKEPAFNSAIIGRKVRGNSYHILFEEGDWRRVRFADGMEGWIFQTLVERRTDFRASDEEQKPTADEDEDEDIVSADTKKPKDRPTPPKKEIKPDKPTEEPVSKPQPEVVSKPPPKAPPPEQVTPPPERTIPPDPPVTRPQQPASIADISATAEQLYNQAIDLYERQQYAQALERNRLALEKAPKNAEILNNIANCLFKMGRIQDALDTWKQALRITPRSGKIANNIGIASYQLDRNQQAIEYYKQAIMFEPDFPDPYYNLASVYGFTGNFEKAIEKYRKFLDFNPDQTMQKLAKQRIEYCQRQIEIAQREN